MKITLNADEKDLLLQALLDAYERADKDKRLMEASHRKPMRPLYERDIRKENLLAAVLTVLIESEG